MEKYYWLNDLSREFLSKWYLVDWQTAEERIAEIGKEFERRLGIRGVGDKFIDYMSKGYYSLATPIRCNYGNNRWLPISCYGSMIEDNMESILYTQAEVGMMSKVWWWTSWYFGKLRPRWAEIKNNWTSSWPIHFMKLFSNIIDIVSQGSSRRWAFTPYFDIDHPDIMEFLKIGTEWDPIQNMTTAVCVKDQWLQDMIHWDEDKRAIWAEVLKRRSEVWFPYITFIDNANRNKPEAYKDTYIYNSNLCVAPDTLVLTSEWYLPIWELEDKYVDVRNGFEWSNVQIKKTWTNQKLIRVYVEMEEKKDWYRIFDRTATLDCTEYHKWHLEDWVEIEAQYLKRWDILQSLELPDGTLVNYKVTAVKSLEDLSDTYCFTEPKRNLWVFNWILTWNCNEIYLPTNDKESFVCCLSSINLLHWDTIKDTDAIELLLMFLDTVMSEFIEKLSNFSWGKKYFMNRALEFARNHRALWLGVLWRHSYLQSKMISFESQEAKDITTEIRMTIHSRTHSASKWLWSTFWECKMTKWLWRRNTCVTAIAPTTSSAFILGQVSQSIEPYMSNYYIKDTAKIKTTFKNPYLQKLLEDKWYNNEAVWKSILDNDWSVQHLTFLSKEERDVFKTFGEIDQNEILLQAQIRQRYLDQWQSLNLLIPIDWTVKQINDIHLKAWSYWIKWLYYQHSYNKAQQIAKDIKCVWCES